MGIRTLFNPFKAYLVLAKLFELDLLEPIGGVVGDGKSDHVRLNNTDEVAVVEDAEDIKVEPFDAEPLKLDTAEDYAENIHFSNSDSDSDLNVPDDLSDILTSDDDFETSKKSSKVQSQIFESQLSEIRPEQVEILEEAFQKCPYTSVHGTVKGLIAKTGLHRGVLTAWFRQKRKTMTPHEKTSARAEMIKQRSEVTVPCPVCHKEVTKVYLKMHLRRVHSDIKNVPKAKRLKQTSFPCTMCPSVLKTKSGLKHHIKVVHDNQPQTCEQCGKSVRNIEALKQHIRLYHAEKRFVCDICDFRATHQCKLDLHRLKHFPDKMPFKCEYCSYGTTERRNLEAHVRKHTGEKRK